MTEATSPAVRSLSDAVTIAARRRPLFGVHVPERKPLPGARRVRPDEPFVCLERENGRGTLGRIEPVEPGIEPRP